MAENRNPAEEEAANQPANRLPRRMTARRGGPTVIYPDRRESPITRQERLASNRARTTEARKAETPQARKKRLAANRDRNAAARKAETPETRRIRLARRRAKERKVLTAETPETRSRRLALKRKATADSRNAETPNTRKARATADKNRLQAEREDITPYEGRCRRYARNSRARELYRARQLNMGEECHGKSATKYYDKTQIYQFRGNEPFFGLARIGVTGAPELGVQQFRGRRGP
ncbi:unnamed protein product [Ectocarpus fasciculatus]